MRLNRFGIFLPVRNGFPYLREAIDSIISQNNDEWELFILDNASTDGTVELIEGYRHPRIHMFKSALPLAISDSWDRILQLIVSGSINAEFGTIMGHDDILLPNFLDSISQLIAKEPNASVYQTFFDIIDDRGNLIRPCRPIPETESSMEFLESRLWGLRDSVGTGYVFRLADYIKVGGIPTMPSLLYADDLLIARLSDLGYKASTSKSECLYRFHRASASNQMTGDRVINQIFALSAFIGVIQKEFMDFMSTRRGRMGLANLLAREVMVVAPIYKHLRFNKKASEQVAYMSFLYDQISEGINYQMWLGTNFISRYLYTIAKRLMLIKLFYKNYFNYIFYKK